MGRAGTDVGIGRYTRCIWEANAHVHHAYTEGRRTQQYARADYIFTHTVQTDSGHMQRAVCSHELSRLHIKNHVGSISVFCSTVYRSLAVTQPLVNKCKSNIQAIREVFARTLPMYSTNRTNGVML